MIPPDGPSVVKAPTSSVADFEASIPRAIEAVDPGGSGLGWAWLTASVAPWEGHTVFARWCYQDWNPSLSVVTCLKVQRCGHLLFKHLEAATVAEQGFCLCKHLEEDLQATIRTKAGNEVSGGNMWTVPQKDVVGDQSQQGCHGYSLHDDVCHEWKQTLMFCGSCLSRELLLGRLMSPVGSDNVHILQAFGASVS